MQNTNEKILSLLRVVTSHMSGEGISKQLGISRTAIWKHIQELRGQGYDIIAVPHLGYQLVSSPDKLLPSEISFNLATKIIGKKIYYYDSLGSTMDVALDFAMKDSPEGTVVCSESQHKGRGRLGRSWSSQKGEGIYISCILRPSIQPVEAPGLTLLSAVAVCQAIREITRLDCRIKWPNDLLIDGKKVGGILTEMNAEMDRVKFVIIGIGLNVNTSESLLPAGGTSLKERLGRRVCRVELTQKLLRNMEREYLAFTSHGFKHVTKEWRKLSMTLGHRVKVMFSDNHIEGEALDIDTDGGLLVRRDSGFVEKVLAGDIVKIR